nr:hypothetical protein [Tanacetum cinerariifolium]
MTKLLPASPNTDTAPMYDINGILDVPNFDHYYDNKMYNLFAHEEKHTELPKYSQGIFLEQHNNINIHSETLDMDFGGEDGEQHVVNDEETKDYFESLLYNFKVKLDKSVLLSKQESVYSKHEKARDELKETFSKCKDELLEQIIGLNKGNVAALVIRNNQNGQNANQIRCYNYKGVEACIPLTSEQHNFLSYASDEERKEWELTNNYLFMTKLLPASPNTDTAPMYDINGILDVPNFDHYYDNKMYNLFAHEEKHTELPKYSQGIFLEQHNNINIHSETLDMDFGGEDGEQHVVNDEETKAYFESLLYNFKVKLDKSVLVNCNDKIKIERLTTELA